MELHVVPCWIVIWEDYSESMLLLSNRLAEAEAEAKAKLHQSWSNDSDEAHRCFLKSNLSVQVLKVLKQV